MAISTFYGPLTFNGNGSTTAFAVSWQFLTGTLIVTAIDEDDVETLKTITTHYTVSGGTTSEGLASTGTVTMLAAPASGTQLRITRSTALTQTSVYVNGDAFPAKTHEAALDKLTLLYQEGLQDAVLDEGTYFFQDGIDAVGRTWQSKGRDIVSVKDFAATGDGVTDDRDAIQAAIDAVIANGGGTVIFPAAASYYLCGSTITLDPTVPVELVGLGFAVLRFGAMGSTVGMDVGNASTLRQPFVAIRNLGIWSDETTSIGLRLRQLANCELQGVSTYNHGTWGITASNCYTLAVRYSQIDGGSSGGMQLLLGSDGVLFDHVTFINNSTASAAGLEIDGATTAIDGVNLHACSFELNYDGLRIKSSTGIIVRGCYFDANTNKHVHATATSQRSITFDDNTCFGNVPSTFDTVAGLRAKGNVFHGSGSQLSFTGCTDVDIGPNQYTGGGTSTPTVHKSTLGAPEAPTAGIAGAVHGIYGAGAAFTVWRDITNNVEAQVGAESGAAVFGSYTNDPVIFRVNNVEVARLTSSGLSLPLGSAFSWDSGAVTLTHSEETLTIAGGELVVEGLSATEILIPNNAPIAAKDSTGTANSILLVSAADATILKVGKSGGTIKLQNNSFADLITVTEAANAKIGGTANRGTTEGTNQVVLFNGTAPVGTLTNGVSLYSASGELRSMDAAGNSTLLSPHDHDTNEWIYHSVDTRTGKGLRIDMERMMRALNERFGWDFVHEFTGIA